MGSLFKPKVDKPKPVAMPDPEDPQTEEAEELRRRQIAARSGRSSTILSRGAGTPGTSAYQGSLLGQA